MSFKQKRNEPCFCNSGKKFKSCCSARVDLLRKYESEEGGVIYIKGHAISSTILQRVFDWFNLEYPGLNVIDVSDVLTPFNYPIIQRLHYSGGYGDTVIVAERTPLSQFVFEKRSPKYTNIIIMFKGAYKLFTDLDFVHVCDDIKKMIDLRITTDDNYPVLPKSVGDSIDKSTSRDFSHE